MALQIPPDFDVKKETLDANETYVRDQLGIHIENWARFRYTIHLGLSAENLHSANSVSEGVKAAYRELGKSHYEVVTSLGHLGISLDILSQSLQTGPLLLLSKSLKDFYFHIGCILDNLARLVYIINDPQSATAVDRRGRLRRHWIAWGHLGDYSGYARLKRSRKLGEIRNIRNNLTHSWSCPFIVQDSIPYWPLAIRTKRDHLWLYDEIETMRRRYRRWLPLLPMVQSDFEFIEGFQNTVFGKLARDVAKFEQNYGIEIR